jgi:Flp pilus assembly protein TadG
MLKNTTLAENFIKDRRANMTIVAALTLLPILTAVGAAIDYSRLSSASSNYQQATDAAVLAASKKRASMNDSEMKAYARKIFNANVTGNSGIVTTFNLDNNRNENKLTLETKGQLHTSFMGIIGIENMNFNIMSQVALPSGGLEVALVLDNTDSMDNDGKIKALKVAANNFVTLLMPGKKNTDKTLKIGIVPFGNYVNVGKKNRNKPWMNVPKDYTEKKSYRPVIRKYDCQNKWYSYTSKGYTYEGKYHPPKLHEGWRKRCKKEYGPKKHYTRHYKWKGCVGSREYPNNLGDDKYSKEKIPGLINQNCTREILPLTSNKKKITKTIRRLNTRGETYIPAGVSWGRRVLSRVQPFSEGSSTANLKSEKAKQVLVLMTDGQNTKSKHATTADMKYQQNRGAYHDYRNLAEANKWTKEACTRVKLDNIEVYTVTFGTDLNDDTKLLMRNCASDPDKYFDASSGDALDAAFQYIANSIRKVYLTQ